ANHRMVFDGYVPGECADVGDDDVITQTIVVRDVAVSQNVVVGTDFRHFAVAGRAVNRYAFAKGVVIADFGSRQAALPFQILGWKADAREWKEFVSASDASVSVDDNVWMQSATCP